MVKNGVSSLIRGIFYTIGKVIAFILIGLLIGFLAVKFNVPIKNLVMLEAHAAESFNGNVSYYVQQGTTTSIQSGYQDNMSGLNIGFPTQNYFTLNKRNLYYYFIKEIDVTNSAYNFQANHTYNIKLKFTMGSYIQRAISVNNGISPSYGPVTYCGNGTCTKTSSCSASPDNTCTWTIIYNSNTTHTGLTLSFGSIYDVDKYIFWNNSSDYDQGIRLDLSSIEDTTQSVDLSPIIDSQYQNAQDIINNQNDNSQRIVDEINRNNDKLTESQKVCKRTEIVMNKSTANDFSTIGYLASNGNLISYDTARTSDYLQLSKDTTFTISRSQQQGNAMSYCIYDLNYNLIGCTSYGTSLTISDTISQDGYVRFSGYVGTSNATTTIFISNICKNGNQALSDDFNDLENRLFEHSNPDMEQVLEDFNDLTISDTPITDLLTLPLHLVQAFYNGITGACSTINLGEWFDHVMYIPCINLENYLGSTLWGIIDLLFCGFMIYNISQLMLHDFDSLSSAEDLFDETYTPKHHKDRRSDRYD